MIASKSDEKKKEKQNQTIVKPFYQSKKLFSKLIFLYNLKLNKLKIEKKK